MTSILFLIERIQCNQIRCFYLEHKNIFQNISLNVWNLV